MRVKEPIRMAGAASLAATGALHLVLAPEYLAEKTYVGLLFIAGGITAIALAAVIWLRGDIRAWVLGGLLAAGMGIGLVLSRTVGLPGFHESEWEISGFVSLLLEAVTVAAALREVGPGVSGGRASSVTP